MMNLIAIIIAHSLNIANIQTARMDNWTTGQNPASLVELYPFQIAATYENHYMNHALHTATIQSAFCSQYINVGVGFSFFGYSKYQEMMTGITLSKKFGRFSLGIQANYITIYCGDYLKYKGTFIPELGCIINITPTFNLGFWTFNPFLQKIQVIEQEKRNLPSIYSIGTDYLFHPDIRWGVQFDYDIFSSWRIASNIEWKCCDILILKLGAYYKDNIVGCLGMELMFDKWGLNQLYEYNSLLGFSSQTCIYYHL